MCLLLVYDKNTPTTDSALVCNIHYCFRLIQTYVCSTLPDSDLPRMARVLLESIHVIGPFI